MTRKIAHKIIIILLLVTFYSCGQRNREDKISIHNNTGSFEVEDAIYHSIESMNLDSILIASTLRLKEKKVIDSKEIPLKLAYKKWLFPPEYLDGKNCVYEKWEYKDAYLEIFTIQLSNYNETKIFEVRLDSICNNSLPLKTSYQKKFRGHKLDENQLVLFKHNFFTTELIKEYNTIVEYINKDFFCW